MEPLILDTETHIAVRCFLLIFCKHIVGAMVDLKKQSVFGCLEALDSAIFGTINLRSEMIGNAVVIIVDRTEMELVPKSRSIFLVVDQLDIYLALFLHPCADFGDRGRRSSRTLKKATVAPEDSFAS